MALSESRCDRGVPRTRRLQLVLGVSKEGCLDSPPHGILLVSVVIMMLMKRPASAAS